MPNAPLDGIRVISFGVGAVIPDFGKILGEFGADVIKIESIENLDFMRTIGPDMNNIPGFNESNRSKRSFGVNLKTEKGKELVRQLIRITDIIGENFRGGVMKSLGFDYESVRQVKPDIIYLSSQGFGSGGPYSDYQAYGPMLAAASGVLSLWAHPDDPYPVGSNVPLPDHMASKQAVVAVLAALDYRRRTGKGQFIDMSQVEVAAALIGEAYLDYALNKRVPKAVGNRSLYAAPYGCYRCQGDDQWCAISVFTNDDWQRFCNALGNPAWTRDPKFADTVSRLKNVDELDRLVEEWTVERDPHEVMNTLQAAGVAAGVAQRSVDTLNDPQLKWLNAIIEVDHPVAGKRLYPGIPFKISNMTFPESKPAPLLGQHTEEICRELLQMSGEEIKTLKEEKVLESPA
ncbi:MAG: CoA transferase [Dehalococcoidia bacterium]|nr:CoA transferase [Dehalococcoidia bacterium]